MRFSQYIQHSDVKSFQFPGPRPLTVLPDSFTLISNPGKGREPGVVKKTGNLFKNEGIYYGYTRSSPLAEKAYSHIIERNGPVCCSPLSPDFLMEPAQSCRPHHQSFLRPLAKIVMGRGGQKNIYIPSPRVCVRVMFIAYMPSGPTAINFCHFPSLYIFFSSHIICVCRFFSFFF